jgi:GNAT superfamily N-acetyltransferase
MAGVSDLQTILSLYEYLHAADLPIEADIAKRNIEHIVGSPGLEIIIAEYEGAAAATCYLNVIRNLTRGGKSYGVVENVVTHPDYRRRGFGRELLEYALNRAWRAECYKVMIMTGNAANIPFFQSVGFDASAKHAFVAKPKR